LILFSSLEFIKFQKVVNLRNDVKITYYKKRPSNWILFYKIEEHRSNNWASFDFYKIW
jgi:hypothetical protein